MARQNADDLITFHLSQDCIDYINSLKNKNQPICFITSGSVGITVIPLIQNIDQIDSILVFCMKKRYHEIHRILNTYNELIVHLQMRPKSIDQHGLIINIFDIEKLKELRD
ncbi:unnamed protein product [Rotaria socialis]|uniref:Uncharacterized protein n=1 Tax=Rotaria socialis TaxID=392032 RepID=A0A820HM59_9BILA|nr:unnamed protein product [Rotaria socialis]CAF3306476.1 unnamed protein product [Rotaria socialis]CAF3372824.1 unnamed protein product [Rotaria socialis]CAF3498647.1 unnamed protein product [Rotaria socialis]CAF3632483.1 unnamed protein product [Rotaria socialis]